MHNISIRRAENTDDFLKIASCIYLTDPFIYPAAFGKDKHKAAYAISRLMTIDKGLLHPDNLVIANHEEEICGVLLFNKNGAIWDKLQCNVLVQGIVPSIEDFDYVSDMYFSVASAAPPEKHIDVIACCVIPGFRNMGIATSMFNWLIMEYSGYNLTLDVLANNSSAISLYEKCGFKITEKLKGFSLEEASRPDCYRMTMYSPLCERKTQI